MARLSGTLYTDSFAVTAAAGTISAKEREMEKGSVEGMYNEEKLAREGGLIGIGGQ